MFSLQQFQYAAEAAGGASSLVMRMGSDGHLYDSPQDADIHSLLDSKFDAEKAEGVKRLLALMAQGCDVSNFFPHVVKNVASTSLEVKKLVYIYLVHYAERRPDEALLSINSFQKDLSDLNPLVRAWALCAMSGIRVHVVAPLVLMAVSKCARDPSPYVRRCAANAIPKLYDLNPEEHYSALLELIDILLNDNSVGVLGAAAAAFNAVCPENLTLIGSHFKRLCEALPDVEEWGQSMLIDILLRYVIAKHGFPETSTAFISGYASRLNANTELAVGSLKIKINPESIKEDDNYHTKEGIMLSRAFQNDKKKIVGLDVSRNEWLGTDSVILNDIHSDIKLILLCTSPLLWSRNSAVVFAAAGVHWFLASVDEVKRMIKPILFLLRSSYDSQYVVLVNLQTFVEAMPSLFEVYYEDFFVRCSDTYPIRVIKLKILSLIATETTIHAILKELEDYVRQLDRQFAADAVSAIGLCAERLPSVSLTCIKGLLSLVQQSSVTLQEKHTEKTAESEKIGIKGDLVFHPNQFVNNGKKYESEEPVLTHAILAFKTILQNNPAEFEKVFVHLIRSLDLIKIPTARATVVWMIGEYGPKGDLIPKMLPTIMKYLASCFAREELESKLQIINCAAKVVMHCQASSQRSILVLAAIYILDMAKNDMNYDIRDRARMLKKLLESYISRKDGNPDQTSETEVTWTSNDSQNSKPQIVKFKGNPVSSIFNHLILSSKTIPLLSSETTKRVFLPGSLSHIVQHTAPGYRPLPKPQSFHDPNSDQQIHSRSEADEQDGTDDVEASCSSSYVSDSDESLNASESCEETSDNESYIKTDFKEKSKTSSAAPSTKIHVVEPLISLSDGEHEKIQNIDKHDPFNVSDELLMHKKNALESWLETGDSTSELSSVPVKEISISGYGNIIIGEVHVVPKKYTLLDYTNGDGLNIMYGYSDKSSSYSPSMVCINLFFHNRSKEILSNIIVKCDETVNVPLEQEISKEVDKLPLISPEQAAAIPTPEILTLDPDQSLQSEIHVRFHQHFAPLKLQVYCNNKQYSVALRPEIGMLMRPKNINTGTFMSMESQMSGMLESSRRCIFKDSKLNFSEQDIHDGNEDKLVSVSKRIVSRVLSSFHMSVVSATIPVSTSSTDQSGNSNDVKGLCLRFSGETLSSSSPCLTTIIAEDHCSLHELPVVVKVNCEDAVFGSNLLKKLVDILTKDYC